MAELDKLLLDWMSFDHALQHFELIVQFYVFMLIESQFQYVKDAIDIIDATEARICKADSSDVQ